MEIVIIGSGNLATHLACALNGAGHKILQVYSRTEAHAHELAEKVESSYTACLEEVRSDADAYVFSVKDDALSALIVSLSKRNPSATYIHTAGSIPMNIFKGHAQHYGVLYPMQTFSKGREVDFLIIPCFIEANDEPSLTLIRTLAESISDRVVPADSERRKKLHLAAVLACNLANHCYRLAERVLEEEETDFGLFLPLIEETARKVKYLSPREAQTGPMVRYDKNVMEMQLSLLPDERTRQIYRLMAESIHADY